jgi:ribose transport system substrate-binding protein
MHSALRFCVPLAALVVGLFAGCTSSAPNGGSPASGTKRIVFLINTPDPYWDALNAGLIEGAEQYDLASAGLTVSRDSNNTRAKGQIEKLRQYATQSDIVAVAISPMEADNPSIVAEMRKLQKQGVKVITVDADINREQFADARSYYIGTDNILAGRALGTATKAILESKGVKEGGYVQFVGQTNNDNARARMDGFKESVGDSYLEVDRMADDGDRRKARSNVTNALANHPDLVGLVGIWAYNAPAIAEVVNKEGVRDQVTVATFDAQSLAIKQMEEGRIDVMVVQNPFDMGVQTVRLLKAMLNNDQTTVKEMFPNEGKPGGDIYTTGLRVVVPKSGSAVKPEMFDSKVVEFMFLPDFQAWLKKYNLTDS